MLSNRTKVVRGVTAFLAACAVVGFITGLRGAMPAAEPDYDADAPLSTASGVVVEAAPVEDTPQAVFEEPEEKEEASDEEAPAEQPAAEPEPTPPPKTAPPPPPKAEPKEEPPPADPVGDLIPPPPPLADLY